MHEIISYYSAALWKTICGRFFADKRCLACQIPFYPEKSLYLCPSCAPHIDYKQGPSCKFCGHKLSTEANICIKCIKNPPPWNALNYYGFYNNLLKSIILKYKFSADFALLPLLVFYLSEAHKKLPPCDILIPMPRHEKRLTSEGFNHTLELCRPLATQLNIALKHKSLVRTRYTPPQSSLPAKKRKNNPLKSFKASNVQGKNVLLVDDIITTGSTLHHASLALSAAGAKNIYILVIARVEK